MAMTAPHSAHTIDTRPARGLDKLASLRTKFVLFFSLILILSGSTLSWYFIESRRVSMRENLDQLGTILLTSVVNNNSFRYGAVIGEDRERLREFTESLMAIDDVVYVVIRGTDHLILSQQNKLVKETPGSIMLSHRFYPDESIAEALYREPSETPVITPLVLSAEKLLVPNRNTSGGLWILSPLKDN